MRYGTPLDAVEDNGKSCGKDEEVAFFVEAINECSIRRAASMAFSRCFTWSTWRTKCCAMCGCKLEINWEVTYVGQDLFRLSPSFSS